MLKLIYPELIFLELSRPELSSPELTRPELSYILIPGAPGRIPILVVCVFHGILFGVSQTFNAYSHMFHRMFHTIKLCFTRCFTSLEYLF